MTRPESGRWQAMKKIMTAAVLTAAALGLAAPAHADDSRR